MKLRPFELVMIVVFGVMFFVALIMLRGYTPTPDETVTQVGTVDIWGTLPAESIDSVLKDISTTDKGFLGVTYRYIPASDFDSAFVNALADQKPPDLILISHEKLVEHRNRLQAISYDALPMRDFRDKYIDGAEVLALNDGIYGIPLGIDPLVLYWNRDIFTSRGFLTAPVTWEALVGDVVPTITARDFNRNIKTAAVAMGEYRNISNAHGILSMLLLQSGSSLVKADSFNLYKVNLDENANQSGETPFLNAATFFSNFSNVNNSLYSWNRSLRLDRDMFLSEDLALYFGYASEGRELAAKNPNLSFDIAEVPKGASATVKRTYGQVYAFVVPKTANNQYGAYVVAQTLASPDRAKRITDGTNLAPALRSLLALGSNDIYGRVAYLSVPYTRAWLNPDMDRLGEVYIKMLEDISSNRREIGQAVSDAIIRITQSY